MELIKGDPVPQCCAGINTISCKCGWEFVYIAPEENVQAISLLLGHLSEKHQITLPTIYCTNH